MRHIAELRRAVLAAEVELDRHERDARYLGDLVTYAAEQHLAAEYQQRQALRSAAAVQARDAATAAVTAARAELDEAIAAQPVIWPEPAATAGSSGHWYLLASTTGVLLRRLLEAGRPAEVPDVASDVVLAYRRAAAAPGADRGRIAADLGDLAATAAQAQLYDVAVHFDRAEIDTRRDSMANDAAQASYWFTYARAWYYLLYHLYLAEHLDELTSSAPNAISIYRQAASAPGIDTTQLGADLTAMGGWAAGKSLNDLAATFDKAAIDVLQGHPVQA